MATYYSGFARHKWLSLSGVVALFTGVMIATPSVYGQATFQVINNFNTSVSQAADYFGHNYGDDQVWLYFLNTSGTVTYTDTSDQGQTVADATSIRLSTVQDGKFNLGVGATSTKIFAGLGSSNPFSGTNGPGIFDTYVPYALTEWTINGNVFDNVDVSYEDSFSYPTRLTVKDSGGNQTAQAGFQAGTQASDVINALSMVMPTTPTGPNNANYPTEGQGGYGPLVPTIDSDPNANRWIGSSKNWVSAPGADSGMLRSLYTYAPSLNDYYQYLQDNEPTTTVGEDQISGWYIDYSGNGGYSGFMQIKGNEEDGFSIEINNIRVNTDPSAANDWEADPSAGTAATGTITIIANGSTVPFTGDDGATNVTGSWLDAVIYSGAAILGDLGGGPIVIGTGDFDENGDYNDIVATFLASLSASMATGLLGSPMYVAEYTDPDSPKSTMYWFNTLPREDALTELFAEAWDPEQEFYDPYWAILAAFTEMQGYLSPFNDRWSNFSPDFSLGENYEIIWELGIQQIPEPSTYALIVALAATGLVGGRRLVRRSQKRKES
jgi:hypothetical protein